MSTACLKTKFNIPVLYFTQMIGLAFGLDAKTLDIGKELVDARRALAKVGVEIHPKILQRKTDPQKRSSLCQDAGGGINHAREITSQRKNRRICMSLWQ